MSKIIKKLRSGGKWRVLIAIAMLAATFVYAEGPQWWTDRGVINTNQADDFASVNLGQLKWIASNAYDECIAQGMPENPVLWSTLTNWFADGVNYDAANVGQVKHLGSLFHIWLEGSGSTNTVTFSTNGNNFAIANIGQVKNVFNFEPVYVDDPNRDTDGDGVPDIWELINGLNPLSDADAALDSDNDGLTNLEEYNLGSDPQNGEDALPLLEATRQTIINHWNMTMDSDLIFTNVPGSQADLNDMKNAIDQFSGELYEVVKP